MGSSKLSLKIFTGLFAGVCFFSCREAINNRTDLIRYVDNSENGLRKIDSINGIRTELKFRPWQLLPRNAMKNNDSSILKIERVRYYFVFSFSKNRKEVLRQLPYNQYSELIQVLAFRMPAYVRLILDNGKTVEVQNCLFQQTYGMANENMLMLVFDQKQIGQSSTLDLRISEFGLGTGVLDFVFKLNDIKKIQNINF